MQPRNWEYELKTFICLYVYWQLAEAVNGPAVTKEAIADFLLIRGRVGVETRIAHLRKMIASKNGNDTFVLDGR